MEQEIQNLQQILQKDPSNFQARRELSIILADNGFNEEALSNMQYLEKFFPEDAELQYNIGILYEKTKDYANAKISYEKAIELEPQEDFYYNLGEVLISLEEWDNAIDAFKNVLKTDPNDGNCYFNLGICYMNKEENNIAIDNFQKATELNPQDIFAYFYLGNLYQNNGLTNFATECYEKVLSVSPDYSWAYFNLAYIAYKDGNIEQAKEYLLKTIEFNKHDIEAYKLLAKIYIKENELEEIISILSTRTQDDAQGDLYYILSQVYKTAQDSEKYIQYLEMAIDTPNLTYPKNIVKQEYNFAVYKLEHSGEE